MRRPPDAVIARRSSRRKSLRHSQTPRVTPDWRQSGMEGAGDDDARAGSTTDIGLTTNGHINTGAFNQPRYQQH